MEERKIMYSKLKEPQEQWRRMYQNRLDRFLKLVKLNAPPTIIANEAKLISNCFHQSLSSRLGDWYVKRCPRWILWLTSGEYRKVSRMQVDEPAMIFDPDEENF
jgi:hypothetical protein